jgi:hypothetical protein
MPVKNLSKPFTCLICQQRKPWGDMVKHVGYAGDSEHEQWRINHGFPARIAFGSLKKHEPALRIAVVSEFPQ